ncbi:TonB-dependent siderophore receptor [Variovorax terrae]|uniref:TonB-dependent siderophore receptor n=1 Tax=Variovorax terrae TaxID=2923278 RepID=A0A9X1VW41_9BURK|nr:TonB-dependent siderophore receptor [Variovorax terrae]MCJ0763124.1 TonB-dependent siderophore receptor [Variovorax terrae]
MQRSLAATLFIASTGWAQTAPPPQGALKPVTISERSAAPQADVSGFGDLPARDLPLSTTVVDQEQMQAAGVRHLSDLTRIDPSTTDSYNSAGYWDFLTIRGFTLDNRYNYRREGLPISAETSIPLDNKERVELLKGTSGIQSGTSAPGGLVNYLVKRPTDRDLRVVRLEYGERGSLLTAADLGGRFGQDARFGYRFNVAHEELRPELRSANGSRDLLSLATDWRLTPDSVLQAEFEWSRKSQPSQAAFSLLGNRLPAVPDPRINLNNQPWTQPVVFGALTGTLRFDQALSRDWRWSAQLGTQRLKTDDREAFPYGCSAEGNYDRYCSDGTYDVYDFRSEGERRRFNAAKLQLQGSVSTGAFKHDLSFGLLRSTVTERYNLQAYNRTDALGSAPGTEDGIGNINGTLFTQPSPALTGQNTNRDERSTELFAFDSISWNAWRGWLGLRHTQMQRASVRTDGSQPVDYAQSFTTPWLALSYQIADKVLYVSAGEGVESRVTPNLPTYLYAGQPLPAVKSRQMEAGIRGGNERLGWGLALFEIRRPAVTDDGVNFQTDGEARHRGLEGQVSYAQGPWRLGAGAMLLNARREGSMLDPTLNGLKPVNVPSSTLRASAAYRLASIPALELDTRLTREGPRAVLQDNSIMLPAWTRWDAGATWRTKSGGTDLTFRLAIDNLTDKRYWREAPLQFGHYYLYPGAPRTLRISVQASL